MALRGWRIRKVKWNLRSRERGTTVGLSVWLVPFGVVPFVSAVPLAVVLVLLASASRRDGAIVEGWPFGGRR